MTTTTKTKTRTLHAVACRCNRRRGPVYRDAQGRVVEGLASLPPVQSQDAAAMDEHPWRERTTGPPWPREYSPVNVAADPRAIEVSEDTQQIVRDVVRTPQTAQLAAFRAEWERLVAGGDSSRESTVIVTQDEAPGEPVATWRAGNIAFTPEPDAVERIGAMLEGRQARLTLGGEQINLGRMNIREVSAGNPDADGNHTIAVTADLQREVAPATMAHEYGPHVCARCWGRGWYWSDGLPPVACANGIPCGRRSGTCSACKRSDAEIVEQAWNEDAALIAVRLRNMDAEMRAQWLRHLGEEIRDIAPMASDALKAGV